MKDSSSLRVGVIGVGHLGTHHARLWKNISGAELIGVYDIDNARAQERAKEFSVKAFSSVEELLGEVSAVSIVSVTSTHAELAMKALEQSIHVFVEKPISTTTGEALSMIAAAKKNTVKLQVGHIERFNPAITSLEKYNLAPLFIESHRLAQFTPRGSDVAVVLDLMIHDIDLILSLVRSPLAKVDANGLAVVSDSVDIANARLEFENGCVANVTASRISQRPMRKMRLFQHDAYISIDFGENKTEIFRLAEGEDAAQATFRLGEIERGSQKRTIVYEQPSVPESNALQAELESFRDTIVNDKIPIVSGEDGLRALEVASSILTSIENNMRSTNINFKLPS